MPTLTKENAKHHCRTCLVRLNTKEGDGEDDDDGREVKEIFINIDTNDELQELLSRYIDEEMTGREREYPQNLCLCCYNKLQSFEKFRKRALESAEKLHTVLGNSGVTKVEIDYEFGVEHHTRELNNDDDIYKLLLKDTLMETESVMLDSSTVATLASVEMHDPDPFDTTSLPSISKGIDLNPEDDVNNFDWQKQLVQGDSSDSSYSNLNSDEGGDNQTKSDKKKDVKAEKATRRVKSVNNDNADDDDEEGDDEEGEDEEGDEDDEDEDEEDEEEREDEGDNNDDVGKTRKEDKKKCLRSRGKTRNSMTSSKQEKKKRRTKKEMEEWRRAQAEKLENKIKRRNKGTKNSFKCTQCNHCFAHKITLDAHIRKVHEGSKRPFQCDRCDKAYTFIGGLYTHIKEIHETEVRSYTCDHPGCDRVYTSFIAMQKHKRLKHSDIGNQKKYVCEQCGATFNQSGNLKYHRRTKHPTEADLAERAKSKERFECNVCNKLFHSRYTLKYHTLQLHTNDMKYECNICGRRMAKKFMLVQHMLVHSTDKMPCEHCGKQFIRKFELEAHIRAVHMKLKPFECQYCSECFASRKTLRHHEYIHTGEKPYVCDICGQAYRQQTCLKNHRKSHEKLSAEALLAANINRTLMSTFLGTPTTNTGHTTLN